MWATSCTRITMWMLLLMVVTMVSSDSMHHPHHHHYHHPHHHHGYHHMGPPYSHRNQRIIKVHPHQHQHQPLHHKHHKPWGGPPHSHYHENDHYDHYDYVRPRQPPPVPPYYGGSGGSRPRPPPHYKAPSTYGGYPHKSSSNNFRPPVIKEHFRTPTLPSFEYLPSKPVSPPVSPPISHVHPLDDNRGPIHEIPAPNLGPKTHEGGAPSEGLNEFGKHEFETSFVHPEPLKPTTEQGPSYEVTEGHHATNDHVVEGPDGTKSFYAPDPDPSLPVHKVPPTLDPHSTPTNGNEFVPQVSHDFQVLDGGSVSAPVGSLSPHDLYHLMQGYAPQQLLQQPLVTVFAQPTVMVPAQVEHQVQQQQFVHPQYQSFNYVENNPYSGAVPMDNYQSNNVHYEPETSESETNVQQSQEQNLLIDELSNNIADNQIEDFEKEQDKSPIFEMKGEPEVPFYTSLPNKETAEAFATLQAAGSIASNYVNQIKEVRGDQNPEEESEVDIEEVLQSRPLGLTEEQLSKPQKVNNAAEEQDTAVPTQEDVEVQKSIPLYETSYLSRGLVDPSADRQEVQMHVQVNVPTQSTFQLQQLEEDDSDSSILANLDFGQGATSSKFGRRIRPK